MIIFDLRCVPRGHVFEAWFGSSADYEEQQKRGLVSCPICSAAEVEKAPMAPAVPRKSNAGAGIGTGAGAAADAGGAAAGGGSRELVAGDPEKVKQMLGALAVMQRKLIEKSDWVGPRFADEARAIHLGEADARAIHGQATREDAEALAEEGIAVAPLLFPIAPPGEEN